jgi:hypothetical protein
LERTGVQLQAERALEAKLSHTSLLVEGGAAGFGGAGEAGKEKTGIERSRGDAMGDAQKARILPGERRITLTLLPRDLPGASRLELTLDLEFVEGLDKAFENGAESGQGPGRGFIESDAAGASAGAGSQTACF